MISCAIFDFDGTIANTEPVWCDIVDKILKDNNIDKEFNYKIWQERYQHKPNVSEMLVKDYELNMTSEELKDLRNKMFVSFCKEDLLVNHNFLHNIRNKAVIEDLKALNRRTHKCYLVSCSREDAVINALEKLGIKDLFKECYFSVTDKEKLYKEIAEKENIDFNDIVLYEDSNDNIKIGKSLGMLSFLVKN